MWVPRNIIAITRHNPYEHLRDYVVIAKDAEGRVMFKYVMVVFGRGVDTHSTMRVTYSRDLDLIYPDRTRTFRMKHTKDGTPAAFMLRVINELRHWEPRDR